MRVLFITIEFSAGTFSGNGVYARSQVRALAGLGHQLIVISGKPTGHEGEAPTEGAAHLIQGELPVWGRLDSLCSWQDFSKFAASPAVVDKVLEFRPQLVLGVDWHSLGPYQSLAKVMAARGGGATMPPYVYMNYRVYLRTAAEGEERRLMEEMEGGAVRQAALTTALSRSDGGEIERCFAQQLGAKGPVQVLLPALREDMKLLPVPSDLAAGEAEAFCRRRYLSCCVRLSPEKEPCRFVDLVERMWASGAMQRAGMVPLMVGSATTEYAQSLKQRLRDVTGGEAVLVEQFVGPAELADIYKQTRLNVHPCLYDAYGMTVIEAASQGAPSVAQHRGAVGATDLLSGARAEVLLLDLGQEMGQLASSVEALLADGPRLHKVAQAACVKARSWTERPNAEELTKLLDAVVAPEDAVAGKQ